MNIYIVVCNKNLIVFVNLFINRYGKMIQAIDYIVDLFNKIFYKNFMNSKNKKHINAVFIGESNSGKSTLLGHFL